MTISVIIAVYNDLELKGCLVSLFKSEGVDFEVIVIDDGSRKVNIRQITDLYPVCKLLVLEKNQGPAVARNMGVKQASGEVIFFMDSDSQVYSGTLKKIIEKFQSDSTLQGLTITWSDEAVKNNFFNKFKAIETNYLAKYVWKRTFGSNGSAIYKNIFLTEGGFDEKFKTAHAEDFYLGMKLFNRGYKIILTNDILMKNSYVDQFFFQGLRKYLKRSFLRAMVLYQINQKTETSYNSKKFKFLYLLSGVILLFLLTGIIVSWLLFGALFFYLIFFYLNKKLYYNFYKKYGLIFFSRAVVLHYIYVLLISVSGTSGLIYAFLFKKKGSL